MSCENCRQSRNSSAREKAKWNFQLKSGGNSPPHEFRIRAKWFPPPIYTSNAAGEGSPLSEKKCRRRKHATSGYFYPASNRPSINRSEKYIQLRVAVFLPGRCISIVSPELKARHIASELRGGAEICKKQRQGIRDARNPGNGRGRT